MPTPQTLIEPSILSGDFGQLSNEAKRAEEAGADALHIDIMDGHFVPNLTLGPRAVAAINRATDLFLDVHIMVYNPFDLIEPLVQSGADRITFHLEATEDVAGALEYIHRCNGVEAGLALCPDTNCELLIPYLDMLDLALIMTVQPGFGGQSFLPQMLEKVRFIRKAVQTRSLDKKIQVDGGINAETAPICIEAGADVLVSGNYLFGDPDMAGRIQTLRGEGN